MGFCGDIEIRAENDKDFHEAEWCCMKAFYNVYMPGCEEHLLLHNLRDDSAYLPLFSRVAIYKGKIVGGIYFEKAYFTPKGGEEEEIISFGPLFAEPRYQKKGIGEKLVLSTLSLVKERGYKAIIITGVPSYYPRFGFKPCFDLGLTMNDGTAFPALMGLSLKDDYLEKCGGGSFRESDIMIKRKSHEEVEAFDALFPPLEKKTLPGQWKSPNP